MSPYKIKLLKELANPAKSMVGICYVDYVEWGAGFPVFDTFSYKCNLLLDETISDIRKKVRDHSVSKMTTLLDIHFSGDMKVYRGYTQFGYKIAINRYIYTYRYENIVYQDWFFVEIDLKDTRFQIFNEAVRMAESILHDRYHEKEALLLSLKEIMVSDLDHYKLGCIG